MQNSRPILLVEDDNVDAMTVKRALKELHIPNAVVHSLNGEEAMAFLADASKPTPLLVLLDLNMPKMNGMEFLKLIKANAQLRMIPIIVLTTSKEKRDIAECFEQGAAGYMVKPVDYLRFVDIINTVMQYWKSSELPRESEDGEDAELQPDVADSERLETAK